MFSFFELVTDTISYTVCTFRFFGSFSRIFPCYHFHLLHLLQTLLNNTLESAKRNAISWQLLSEFSSRSCKFNRFVQVCNFFKSSRCLMNISSAEEAVQNMMLLKWKQEWCVKKIWKLRRLEKQRGSLHYKHFFIFFFLLHWKFRESRGV